MSKRQKTMTTSFVSYGADCDFSIHNLPYGIFSPTSTVSPRAGVAIGDQVSAGPRFIEPN
jgi:fumarylacetoacetase